MHLGKQSRRAFEAGSESRKQIAFTIWEGRVHRVGGESTGGLEEPIGRTLLVFETRGKTICLQRLPWTPRKQKTAVSGLYAYPYSSELSRKMSVLFLRISKRGTVCLPPSLRTTDTWRRCRQYYFLLSLLWILPRLCRINTSKQACFS